MAGHACSFTKACRSTVLRGCLAKVGSGRTAINGNTITTERNLRMTESLPEAGESMDRAISIEVFGVSADAVDAWPWPLPEFSTDRRWSEAVSQRMLYSEAHRVGFESALEAAATYAGYRSADKFSGIATLTMVLTPDVICRAALMVVRGCVYPESTLVLGRVPREDRAGDTDSSPSSAR